MQCFSPVPPIVISGQRADESALVVQKIVVGQAGDRPHRGSRLAVGLTVLNQPVRDAADDGADDDSDEPNDRSGHRRKAYATRRRDISLPCDGQTNTVHLRQAAGTKTHRSGGSMKISNDSAINLVIVFLGAALMVFLAGVCVVIAVKQTPPTQLWATGGAITGALVGVLMPSPNEGSASAASAKAADTTHAAAVAAAQTASQQPEQQAELNAATQAVASVRAARAQIHLTNARITRGHGPSAAAATRAYTASLAVQALADNAEAAVRSEQQAVDALNNPGQGQHVDPQVAAAANTALAKAQTKRRVLQ